MEHHSSTEVICPTCGRQDCWFTTITGKYLCGYCTQIVDLTDGSGNVIMEVEVARDSGSEPQG